LHNRLERTRQFAARQEHPAMTGGAFQSNICAQTGDLPFVAAAGVLFAQSQYIVQVKFG